MSLQIVEQQFVKRYTELKAGEVTLAWCPVHGSWVRHILLIKSKPVVCLECQPELDPNRKPPK
jgi:hypothetical protein